MKAKILTVPSQDYKSKEAQPLPLEPVVAKSRGRSWRRLLHPLTAILAVQAGLSLTLVWSNTAFSDEADYLWIGRLYINHLLHGASWPSWYADNVLSGSPIIYPPIGALANSVGGLAGARMLSLVFMLGATVLLYLTASRVLNRTAAVFAAAVWVATEPVLRLAFATYDPLSILLTALATWLAVQAAYRHQRGEFVAAAAIALALANATAYSQIVVDPVVIIFAFFVWLPHIGRKQATFCVSWLVGTWFVFFALVMTVSKSWPGLIFTVINRSVSDTQSVLLILKDVWGFSGLIIILAVIGVVTAISAENRQRAALVALLGAAAFLVPLAQLHDRTAYSLDKHLAYGIWFAAIAAGYGCEKLIHWVPGAKTKPVVICCAVAFAYLAVNSWEASWESFHGWSNSRSFVKAIAPIVARSHGLIFVDGESQIAEYYLPHAPKWSRWDGTLSLAPKLPRSAWSTYYESQLSRESYGVIALFYTTTFAPVPLPEELLLQPDTSSTYQELLALVGANSSGEPGLPTLTQALEKDPQYSLVAKGPYNSAHVYGIYAIWQKKVKT